MRVRTIISSVCLGLALVSSLNTKAFLAHGPIELAIGIVVNTLDGNTIHGCIEREVVDRSGQAQLTLGVSDNDPSTFANWNAIYPSVFCANNSQTKIIGKLSDKSVLAGVRANWRLDHQMEDERVLSLEVLITRERHDLSIDGSQAVQRDEVKRTVFFSGDSDAYIPVLLATGEEQKALGVQGIFVSLKATVLKEQRDAVYGSLLVMSGNDGAEVLLDGGVAGKIPTPGEVEIGLVRAGLREVGLRDASGEVERTAVRVEAGRMSVVKFDGRQQKESSAGNVLESLGANEQGYEAFLRKNDGAAVVKIPQGEFLMGNKDTERTPLEHQVFVSDFLMDKTGVSWGQYKQFAADTGIPLPPHKPYWGILDDHPAVYVTWEESRAYCEWTGARLPTEAEREKAARGTDGRKFSWGNEEPDHNLAVFRQSWGYGSSGAVGSHVTGASPYGLLNMSGNVWEWCADWYDGDYYQQSPYRDPLGPALGKAHVVRGGSWDSRPDVLSASCRSWGHRGYRDGDFGFRCAMNAPR